MAGFSNPIIGGAEVLIRSAIKSANYVAGLTGWRISRDGSAELNDATIRGQILAGSGSVRLNASGIHVQNLTSGTQQFDINFNGGFLARRVPDDGSFAQLIDTPNGSNTFNGGLLQLTPTNPTPLGTNVTANGFLYGYLTTEERAGINMSPPQLASGGRSRIFLESASTAGDGERIRYETTMFTVNNRAVGLGVVVSASTAGNAGPTSGTTELALLSIPSFTYKANQAYKIKVVGQGNVAAAPNRPVFRIRKDNSTNPPTGTQVAAVAIAFATLGMIDAEWSYIFQVGANDVTTGFIYSATSSASTVTMLGPFGVEIEHIGLASDYAGWGVLT